MANYLKINKYDTVDGPGVRVSVYFAGCHFHCQGCHNPESWNFNLGVEYDHDREDEIIELCSSNYISGLSILGGEPLNSENLPAVHDLVTRTASQFPTKSIWIWTGYTWEELQERMKTEILLAETLAVTTVCVVGRFKLGDRDITKENLWRGSTNQRVIDVGPSLNLHRPIALPDIPNNNIN